MLKVRTASDLACSMPPATDPHQPDMRSGWNNPMSSVSLRPMFFMAHLAGRVEVTR